MKINLKEIFSIDLRSLALFRISLATLLIVDLCTRFNDITAHYTDMGVIPRSLFMSGNSYPWFLSIHFLSGRVEFQILLFILSAIISVFFLFGYKTKIITLISWYMVTSLHIRNPFILNNGDVLLRMLLFWGIFLPLGARFSLDSILSKSKNKKSGVFFSLGTVAIIAQFIFIYFFTALQKLGDTAWLNGTAVHNSLSLDMMASQIGHNLLNFPAMLVFLNYAILIFELIGPFLILLPAMWSRLLIFLCFLFMQVSFGFSIKLGLFPWISVISSLIFLPASFWDKFEYMIIQRNFIRFFGVKARKIKQFFEDNLPKSAVSIKETKLAKLIVIISLIYMFLLNIQSVGLFSIPREVKSIGDKLFIQQNWQMFVKLGNYDGWYVIAGQSTDGTSINLLEKNKNLTWERPKLISSTYKNQHWLLYMRYILRSENSNLFYHYGRYLCYDWNINHDEKEKINQVKVYYAFEKDMTNKNKGIKLLWKNSC